MPTKLEVRGGGIPTEHLAIQDALSTRGALSSVLAE